MVITHPTTGEPVNLLTNEDVYGLAYKVIDELIIGADIRFRYPELNRTVEQWGAILGTVRMPAQESVTPDPDAVTKCAPHYPDPVALYVQEWVEKRFYADYRPIDATKVLTGQMSMDVFIATLYNSLIEGYAKETNIAEDRAMSYQLGVGETATNKAAVIVNNDGTINTGSLSILPNLGQYEELPGSPSYAKIYGAVSKIVSRMVNRENGDYSDSFVCGARHEDLCVYLPSDFTAVAGIDFLAKWNNLAEVNKLPELREAGGLTFTKGGEEYGIALVMDKRFLSHVERYRDTMDYEDACRGHARGTSLLINEGLFIFTSYKAFAIIFKLPTDDAINVNVVNTVTVDGEGALV